MINAVRPPREILEQVGARARELRLARNWRQAELAKRAGVGVITVHRFEATGMASLDTVVRIAIALSAEQGFEHLFAAPPFASLDEAIAHSSSAAKKRRNASRRRR